MADNDYIGEIQSQRLNQQWTNSMSWSTPSWMRGNFKQGPRVSQTPRYRTPSSGTRLDWGTNQQIMDRGFNKGDKWSERYKDKPMAEPSTTTPLAPPTAGTAVTGPTAPATPSTPTATSSFPAPSTAPMMTASSGQPRPVINMGQNAVRASRAQRRSSGTVI